MIVDFNTRFKEVNQNLVGNKFYNLYLLKNNISVNIPEAFCVISKDFNIEEIRCRIDPIKKYAIRSSSNSEDLEEATAAGIFKTFLNVQGLDNILTAIDECFNSVHTVEVKEYIKKKNLDSKNISLAVIIQEMIIPDKSGVLFTLNPVTGENEILIEMVTGLAEKLVDGKVVPERYVLRKKKQPQDNLKKSLLSAASEIEQFFNKPQDIEWAYSNKQLYILQSRPIFVKQTKFKPHEFWTRANIGEIIPTPLTPLSWDIFEKVIFNSYRFGFYSFHDWIIMNVIHLIPREWPAIKSPKLFNGYAYLNLETVLLSFSFEPWVNEEVLNFGLGFDFTNVSNNKKDKLTTKIIKLLKGIIYYFELIFPIFSFENRGFSYIRKKIESLSKNNDLSSLLKKVSFVFGWHIAATARSFSSLGFFQKKQSKNSEFNVMLQSLAAQSQNEFINLLSEIQELAAKDKQLFNFIKNNNLDLYKEWHEYDNFKSKLGMFLEKFGHRSPNEFELKQNNWVTEPSLLKQIILNWNKKGHVQSNQLKIPKTIKKIYNGFRLRENLKDILIKNYGDLKKYYKIKSEKLFEKGVLLESEDIYFLKSDEVEKIEDDKSIDWFELIANRKKIYYKDCEAEAPYSFTGDIDTYSAKNSFDAASITFLKGVGCSPGKIKGKAVHLNTLDESNKLNKGDILITTATDPGWTPLFLVAGGVVTEIGGMLSHAATIAREYGIPMITGITQLKDKIKDNSTIELDGQSGEIEIL